MKTYQAQIDINASPEKVWAALIDFPNYTQWNPFIRAVDGQPIVGQTVTITVARSPRKLSATIRSVKPAEELIWEASMPLNVMYPRYIRRLERLPNNNTRFINREEFRGVLIPVLRPALDALLKPFYLKSCVALKNYVESL
jgi:hypothetical protein